MAYISFALLVCRHSPRRTTSRTRCMSGLILLAGLPLVHIARIASFFSLNFISYVLLVCPHSSHWPKSCARCSSFLIFLTEFHLVRIARLPSFFSLAYRSYWLLVCYHSPRRPHSPRSPTCPTCNTHCSPALMRRLSCSVLRRDLGRWTLYYNVYIDFKYNK